MQRDANGEDSRENKAIKMLTSTTTGRILLNTHETDTLWILSTVMNFKSEHRHELVSQIWHRGAQPDIYKGPQIVQVLGIEC